MRGINQFICKLFFVLIVLSMLSCRSQQAKLNFALKCAQDNRPELEAVLNHYSVNESDSLKLRAAKFLIANMPGHYSYKSDDILHYYNDIDSLLNIKMSAQHVTHALDSIAANYPNLNNNLIEDIRIIKADYLIHNIDLAFEVWQTKPVAEHLNFDQFCEYLLPYKCVDLQQLDYWRDTLATKFLSAYNRPGTDILSDQTHWVCQQMDGEINQTIATYHTKPHTYRNLNAKTIYKMCMGTCEDYTALGLAVLRSHGIPVVKDYYPIYGGGGNGHIWFTLLNKFGNFMPSPYGLQSNPGEMFRPNNAFPKIFRTMYSHNERTIKYLKEAKYKIELFSIFDKDVTSEYVTTTDLCVPISSKNRLADKYVYIGTFSNGEWRLLDFGLVKRNKALFQHMGRGLVYVVFGYDGEKLIPISDPFLLKTNGSIHNYRPDTTHRERVVLSRKFRDVTNMQLYVVENRILGGRIQASNNAKFANSKTFYTINNLIYPDIIDIDNIQKYRYWRFYSANDSYCDIAELQFFERGSDTIAKGKIIGTSEIWENNPVAYGQDNAFDGDYLTYFQAQNPNDGWIGMDFEKPICVDRVRCIARSDGNSVQYGDEYELKYWSEDRDWKSLGVQIAKDKFVHYDSVPCNAILLLENRTRGRQEQIFTYENRKQNWW